MKDCNCKAKNNSFEITPNETPIKERKYATYFLKIFGFIISLILLPVIMLVIIKFLFETIVLNEKVDLKAIVKYYIRPIETSNDNDDLDYMELTEDDVELLNVEEIRK